MARPTATPTSRPRPTRSWATVGRGPATRATRGTGGTGGAPVRTLTERQAQYAAWKERLMQRDEVIELREPTPSQWSVDALFADLAAPGA